MKNNSAMDACNSNLLHRTIGSKSVKLDEGKSKGKLRFVLFTVIGVLVVGVAVVFAIIA